MAPLLVLPYLVSLLSLPLLFGDSTFLYPYATLGRYEALYYLRYLYLWDYNTHIQYMAWLCNVQLFTRCGYIVYKYKVQLRIDVSTLYDSCILSNSSAGPAWAFPGYGTSFVHVAIHPYLPLPFCCRYYEYYEVHRKYSVGTFRL